MITIDKGIPIPAPTYRKYPYAEMKVGDSFFIPGKQPSQVYSSFKTAAAKGKKFIVRPDEVKKVKGVRIWRTE